MEEKRDINKNNIDDLKKIEKSFFNSALEVNGENPRYLSNENMGIQNAILDSLRTCKSFNFAVSYVVLSGLQRSVDTMYSKKKNSKFITTTDGFVTEPRALRVLLNIPNLKVRLFNANDSVGGFHAKTYLFEYENYVKLIVGSANISNRAFGSVHESSLSADISNNGILYKRYKENFDNIWDQSFDLTNKFIDNYEKKYYLYKKILANPNEFLNKDEIKPNLMQEKALKALSLARSNEHSKSLIVASTGSGKTYLAAFDVKNFQPKKTLFLVHNRTILRKAIKSFKEIFKNDFDELELRSKNICRKDQHNFIFSTEKTLVKNFNKFKQDEFDYIIVDEAHHIVASQYSKIIDYFKPKFLLGMTATPDRPDQKISSKDVYAKFNHIIPYEIRLYDAIESNLIAPFNYFGIGEDLASEDIDYEHKVKTIMKNINKYGFYGKKLKALVFVDKIEKARKLANEFNVFGIKAVDVNGSTDEEEVDRYLEDLGNDERSLQVIVSVNKLNEGIDVPEINTIIMLRKTASSIIYIQQLGRGLRKSSFDKFVTVLDFVGNYDNSFEIIKGLTDSHEATGIELKKKLFSTPTMLSNIILDEISRKRIYESIDNNMQRTPSLLKHQFKNFVNKYGYVPSMKEYNEKISVDNLMGDKIAKILLHFNSFQELKQECKYIKLNKRELTFFRWISEGLLQTANKKMLKEIIKLLNNEGAVFSNFINEYLLGKKGPEFIRGFLKHNQPIFVFKKFKWYFNSDLLKNNVFKEEINSLINYIKTINSNNFILNKNYKRLNIPFLFEREGESLYALTEGQFFVKNKTIGIFMPKMSKPSSKEERKFFNKVINDHEIIYITSNDVNTKLLSENKLKELHFFISHHDSKDKELTYIGKGKVIENLGKYKNQKSEISKIKLENKMPKWMVDDYSFNNS